MATKYPGWAPQVFSANWCDGDDGVQDVAKVQVGDAAVFTVNSGVVTLTTNEAADSLDMSTVQWNRGFGTGAARSLDVGGAVIFGGAGGTNITLYCAGDFTAVAADTGPGDLTLLVMDGTGNLTSNATPLSDVQINTAGTVTLADATECGDFTMTVGTFAGSATLTVNGNFTTVVGTWSFTGKVVMGADGTINEGISATLVEVEIPAGVTSTVVSAYIRCAKFSGEGTIQDNGGGEQVYARPTANSFWNFTGTANIGLLIWIAGGATRITGQGITLGNKNITVIAGGVTASGDIDIGTGLLDLDPGSNIVWSMNGYGLRAGNVILGRAAVVKNVTFNSGAGYHKISGNLNMEVGSLGVITLALDSSIWEMEGTLNLVGLVVTNTYTHFINTAGGSGAVSNMPNTGNDPVHCHDIVDGGGNHAGSVDFDKYARPGSLVLMGVGL